VCVRVVTLMRVTCEGGVREGSYPHACHL